MFKPVPASKIKHFLSGASFDSDSCSSSDLELAAAEQLDTANELYFAEKELKLNSLRKKCEE